MAGSCYITKGVFMFIYDQSRCIGCGTCAQICHNRAISIEDGAVVHNDDLCCMCGHCLAVCPRDCIMIDGDGYSTDDVEDLGFASKPSSIQLRNLILSRRSVRSFNDMEVTDEEIDKIIEAARYAPTSWNRQDNAFLVVKDTGYREKLLNDTLAALERLDGLLTEQMPEYAAIYRNIAAMYRETGYDRLFYKAPVVIYIFSEDEANGNIAAAHMNLMAETLQLGMCMARLPVRAFLDEEFRREWCAPENKTCVLALLLGNTDNQYFSSVPRKQPLVIKR